MTNTSFSKITDLTIPDKGRTGGTGGEHRPSPGAAQQFEQFLKSASSREGAAKARNPEVSSPFDRPTPDVRPSDRQPVVDRPRTETRRPERPEPRDRDEVERPEGPKRTDRSDDAVRDAVEADPTDDEHHNTDRNDGAEGRAEAEDGTTENNERGEDGADGGADDDTAEQSDTDGDVETSLAADHVADGSAMAEAADTTGDEADVAVNDGTGEEMSVDGEEAADEPTDDTVANEVAATAAAAVLGRDQAATADAAMTEASEAASMEAAAESRTPGTDEAVAEADEATPPATTDSSADDNGGDVDDDSSTDAADEQTADGEAQSQAQDTAGEAAADADDNNARTGPAAPAATTGATTTSGATGGPVPLAVGETTSRTTAPATAAAQTGQVADGEDGELLWRQVRRAIGSMRTTAAGDQQMTIRLRPAELGSVMIRVTTGEAGTTVALVAESAAAASQLNQQRQQLINELEDRGLTEVAVDVGTNEDPRNETDESDGDGDTAGGDNGSRSALVNQDNEPLDRFRIRRSGGGSAGLVDLDL
ncbi:MAG: flagellar hook-length control protein FliK [Actinomycetota bacterium]